MVKKVGRPTKYCEKLANIIIERVIGGERIPRICKDKGLPAASTVYLWFEKHEEFSDRYYKASALAVQAKVDRIFDILEDVDNEDSKDPFKKDYIIQGDGTIVQNQIKFARQKEIAKMLQWEAGKLAPKLYGDKSKVSAVVTDDKKLRIIDLTGDD